MAGESSLDRVQSGRAWAEFCDVLKSAGQTISAAGAPDSPLERAEGFRYLSRLVRAGLEAFLEYSDPLAPVLHRPIHETAKIGADNPDNYYQHATVSGKYDYRIRGIRRTIHYLDFATQSGGVASSGASRQTGHFEASSLKIEPDGSFDLLLSCDRKPGNWLPMEADTETLIVRQTFLDRETEQPADLRIERSRLRDSPLRPPFSQASSTSRASASDALPSDARFNQLSLASAMSELPVARSASARTPGASSGVRSIRRRVGTVPV